jgi:L-cysteine desulfidase
MRFSNGAVVLSRRAMMSPFSLKDILRMEVAPALGCTEPSAIALASAAAASILPVPVPESIEIWVDPNIYKNAFAVSIPGTGGESGLGLAAALGALAGDPSRGLEVLDTVGSETLEQARSMVEREEVRTNLLADHKGLFVRASVNSSGHTAEAVIEEVHDNLTRLSLNGEDFSHHPLIQGKMGERQTLRQLELWLRQLTLKELIGLLENLDDEDRKFLRKGIEFNRRLARHGLENGSGLGIGLGLEKLAREGLVGRDMVLSARILTSSAADARMSGVKLPAMSSGGSGNHGLTAILPIVAVSEFVDVDEGTVLKAVALSHLVTAYVKAFTGRLSAICGCSVAAGAGAAAGVTFLLGGDLEQIAGGIKNIIGDLAGVICDGAKASCAMKLATAAGTAVQAGLLSIHGIFVQPTDGIVGLTPEETMENVGTLSVEGMIEADRAILGIMIEKHLHGEERKKP